MKFPNFIDEKFTDANGYLTDTWRQILMETYQVLQTNFKEEGVFISQKDAKTIELLNTAQSGGSLLYDSTNNDLMVNFLHGTDWEYHKLLTDAGLSASFPLVYDPETGNFSLPAADAITDGYLKATDWSIFNNKEPAIIAGTALQYWRGDKTWQTLDTSVVPENTNLYYTDTRSRAAISSSATGLTYTNTTGVFSLTTGYVIPTTTQESNWNDAYSKEVSTWPTFLTYTTGVLSLTTGYYIPSTTDQSNWNLAYSESVAGWPTFLTFNPINHILSLTPGYYVPAKIEGGVINNQTINPAPPSTELNNCFGISAVTTPFSLSALIMPVTYPSFIYNVAVRDSVGVWSTGLGPHPYLVQSQHPGTTTIMYDHNGSMDVVSYGYYCNWYIIYTPTSFYFIPGRNQFSTIAAAQAENPSNFDMAGFPSAQFYWGYQLTYFCSSSYTVDGECCLIASPVITQAYIPTIVDQANWDLAFTESVSNWPTHLTFSAHNVSLTTGYYVPSTTDQTNWNDANSKKVTTWSAPLQYSSGTASITQSSGSTNGYLSSTDWTTFNNKEPAISTGTSLQYWRGDKSWQTLDTKAVPENTNLYYTDARARAAISSSATGLTYTSATGVFSLTTGYVIPTTTEETNWNTAYSSRIATFTTTGSSGSATFASNTLNIPTYTLAGLGGQPLSTNLTSLAGLTYASTSFVKMTAAGTFGLDTGTYQASLTGSISGTTNQVNVSANSNSVASNITISAPQNIDSTANPTFKDTYLTDLTGSNVILTTHVTDALKNIDYIYTATHEPTGFTNLQTDATGSFVNGTRTFTITPTGSTFEIFYDGKKYSKTAQSIVIANTEGNHFIYYDNTGTLQELVNPTSAQIYVLVRDWVLVRYIYWDATNAAAILSGVEQHGIQMDGQTHVYEHLYKRTQWLSGLAPNTISADGSGNVNASAQFGMDAGIVQDEDLQHSISSIAAATGLPIYWNSGSGRNLRRTVNAGYSVLTTGSGRLAYNDINAGGAGVWGQTEVGNLDYVLYHIFATNDPVNTCISVMGQANYATLALARAGAVVEINTLIGQLPLPEFKALATFIFETSSSYGNAVKARIRTTDTGANFIDWRATQTTPGLDITTTLPSALPSGQVFVGNASNIATAVTLSGDVTNDNTGVTTIGAKKVTYAKIQDITATNRLLGRSSAGAGSTEEISTIPSTILGNSSLYIGTTQVALNAGSGSITSLSVNLTGNVTGNVSGSSGTCTGNAGSATYASNVTVTNDTTNASSVYPAWHTANTGNIATYVSSTKLSFVPNTGILTATGFSGPLSGNVTGNVTGNVSGSSGSCTGNAATVTGLSVTTGKTLSVSNSITLAGTDSTTMTFPTTSKTIMASDYSNAGTAPTWNQDTTGTAAKATNIAGGGANQVPYQTGANTTSFISSVNNAILVTNGSGVPSFSTSLPVVGQDNLNLPTTTATVGQVKVNNVKIMHFPANGFGTKNYFFGATAGNTTLTGASNWGFGDGALRSLTSGEGNIGFASADAGSAVTTGNNNLFLGCAGGLLSTGSYNLYVGVGSGNNHTGAEASNVYISNVGVASESNVMRIGTAGTGNYQQSDCHIAPVVHVTAPVYTQETYNVSNRKFTWEAFKSFSGVSSFFTMYEITPSTVTNLYVSGYIEARVSAYTTTAISDSGVLVARWAFKYANGAPTAVKLDETREDNAPQLTVSAHTNAVAIAVSSKNGTSTCVGSISIIVFIPNDNGNGVATFTIA
jgi:hypothetical protein